uniref:Pheromone receptor a3 n=1 Tax=Sporisorium reilianum TaxID=72558 RepID=Q4A3E4_9BASI|nr:pra3 protein [Sporisorium reilianum]CAI59763.1 pheromone receptor a3 [Sporisorium reilianum]
MISTIPITVLALAGALLVATLIPSYTRARNIPVILSIFWLCSTSICVAINTAGWQDVADKWKPYCELAIRIVYGSAFGFQCCSALLLRRLEAIAATRYVSLTKAANRRRMIIELGTGLVLPLLYVALAIVNQGHRYDVIEKFGPIISIYPSIVSVILSTAPILIASMVGTTYAILCSYWLFMRRRQLSAVLSSSGSGINTSQYVRLFGLSLIEILWTVPINWTIQMQNLFNREQGGSMLYPYSWSDIHYNFGRVTLYTIDELQQTSVGRKNLPMLTLGSLSSAISCLLFFSFLGTTTDMSKDIIARFKKCWKALASRWSRKRSQPSLSDNCSQPPLTPREEVKMKDLDDSRADDIQIEVLVERTYFEDRERTATSL